MSVQLSEYGSEREARAVGARRGRNGKKLDIIVLALVLCGVMMIVAKNAKPGYGGSEGKVNFAQESKYPDARDSDWTDSARIRDAMRGEESKKMLAREDATTVQYFQVSTGTISASVAQSICHQHGGSLASILSASEQAQAASACTAPGVVGCWIGIERSGHTWKWSDGSPFVYSNWGPGEPNNFVVGEDCGTLMGSKKWNDNRCYWPEANPSPWVLCQRRQCSVGFYLSGGRCVQCPPGHYCTNNVKRQCAAGSYQGAPGQGSCTAAPCGSYVAAAGATSKELCRAGTYQDKVGQTSCVAVPEGYESGVGQCAPTKVVGQRLCATAGPGISTGYYGILRIPRSGEIEGVKLTHVSGSWQSWTAPTGWANPATNWGISGAPGHAGFFLMGMETMGGRTVYPVRGLVGVTLGNFANGKVEFYSKAGASPTQSTLDMDFGKKMAVTKGEQFRLGNLRMMTGNAVITGWHRGTVCFDVSIKYATSAYFSTCSAATKSILGSGWSLVRRVGPSYGKWHPENDNLAGTQAFGTFQNSDTVDATFSKTWSTTPFTQFLFVTGDCSTWVVASKESVIGANYVGRRRACRTSDSPNAPTNVFWYNRASNAEDPWISVIDHAQAIPAGKIVYGENSIGLYAASVVSAKNGANVFIRNKHLDGDGCAVSR